VPWNLTTSICSTCMASEPCVAVPVKKIRIRADQDLSRDLTRGLPRRQHRRLTHRRNHSETHLGETILQVGQVNHVIFFLQAKPWGGNENALARREMESALVHHAH
jgi:hypothetical protein